MGDGTTGTRFLACVVRRLKLPTFHNDPPNKETVPDLTAWYDNYGALLDSPIPYLLDALLACLHGRGADWRGTGGGGAKANDATTSTKGETTFGWELGSGGQAVPGDARTR